MADPTDGGSSPGDPSSPDTSSTDSPNTDPPTTDSLLAGTTLGRVSVTVSDLDTLTAFYTDVVGLDPLCTDTAEVVLGIGEEPLLVLREDVDSSPRKSDEAGLFHTAFRVPTRAALGQALTRIEAADVTLTGASDHLVSHALYLRDPEDNGIEIYCDRPRSDWPTTADGRVEMDSLPLDLDSLRDEAERDAGSTSSEVVPPGTDVGHVHLEVTSLPAAVSFYQEILGLQIRQRWGDEACFLAVDDYHHHVGLNTWNRRTAPIRGRGIDWVEFVCPDSETLSAAVDRFERASLDVTDWTQEARQTGLIGAVDAVAVSDPDGIGIRLVVRDE